MATSVSGDLMPPNPLVLIPGYMGSVALPKNAAKFGVTRGFPASGLTVVPAYLDLLAYFESQGYVKGKNLFVLPYDWRIPLALADGQHDGTLSRVTAAELTDGVIKTQVDYLGEFLQELVTQNPSIQKIDVVAHSNGNNVTRAYVQSPAYGAFFESGKELRLPTIGTFMQMAPPSDGAALSWNIWNNNLIGLDALGGQSTKTLVRDLSALYDLVASGLVKITGPDGDITRASILGPAKRPSPQLFMRKYFPSLQTLNPTYKFLYDSKGDLTDINSDPVSANQFLLDLNANSSPGNNPWAAAVDHIYATYGVTESTVIEDQTMVGIGGRTMSIATGNRKLPTLPGETWFKQISLPDSGDQVVPLASLQSTYQGDPRIEMKPWGKGVPTPQLPFTPTTGNVDHTLGILQNPQIRSWMAEAILTSSRATSMSRKSLLSAKNDFITGLESGQAQPVDASACIKDAGSFVSPDLQTAFVQPRDRFETISPASIDLAAAMSTRSSEQVDSIGNLCANLDMLSQF